MALLKLKDLHSQLEYVDDFENPKIELEQYVTTPHIAGELYDSGYEYACHLLNYGHFGPKTLRTLDTSALVWWVRTVRTDRHWCRSVLKTVRT